MGALKFAQKIGDFRVDAASSTSVFDVLMGLRDVRQFRIALMEMAQIVSTTSYRGIIVLGEPQITEPRLLAEWKRAASVFRPELLDRISIAFRKDGKWGGLPAPPKNRELQMLEEVVQHTLSLLPPRHTRAPEAYYEILRILIHEWLLGKGSISIRSLMEISGTSHPTVAKALTRLEHSLIRHSDRSVELRHFPRDEWARLVAVAADVRGTIHFVDRSGHPRSPESLLKRLRALEPEDVAVGGVWGAKHYDHSIDLIGNPRLDLSVHSAKRAVDLSFVQRLDPALEKSTKRDEPPTLVVHTIRRAMSLFQPGDNGPPWADPVECLLDLHEAHLEAQALDFLQGFLSRKG